MRPPDPRRPHDKNTAHVARRPGHPLAAAPAHPLARKTAEAKAERTQRKAAKPPAAAETDALPVDPAVVPASSAPKAPPAPQVDGEGRRYITLAQMLKNCSLAQTGGAAKHLVRAGGITVNGQPEDRPGRKLHAGDTVVVGTHTITVEVE